MAVCSLIAIILLIFPFVWHIKVSKSIPTLCLIFWLAFENLENCINAFIWSGEDFYTKWDGKVYCDIVTRIYVGSSTGKACALTAISLNLYMILLGNSTFVARQGLLARRKNLINCAICLINPIVVMVLEFFVAAQRYGIGRFEGCLPLMAATWVTLIFYSIYPFLWSIASFVFAVMTIGLYIKKRRDVKDLLRCSDSGLNLKKFARLLVYSVLVTIVIVPTSIFMFVMDVHDYFSGAYNWSEIHWEHWGEIFFLEGEYSFMATSWINFGLSIVTFVLFGLGSEAIKMYRDFFYRVLNIRTDDAQDKVHMLAMLSKDNSRLTNATLSGGEAEKIDTGVTDFSQADTVQSDFNFIMDQMGLKEDVHHEFDGESSPTSSAASNNKVHYTYRLKHTDSGSL